MHIVFQIYRFTHMMFLDPPKWQKNDLVSGAPCAGMAKLGAGVDNELSGSAPHQCR